MEPKKIDLSTERLRVDETRPTTAISSRKIDANRRNAQLSTGPRTPEGKERSSRNAITHGIFVNQLVNGNEPDAAEEIEALAAGIREHYKPKGMLEDLLVQTIVVEAARFRRALQIESPEIKFIPVVTYMLDRIGRYMTSINRSIFRAIQELERIQDARRVRERAPDSIPSVVRTSEQQHTSDLGHNPTSNDAVLDGSRPFTG